MFLYYLLALRLRNKQPTFFQFTKDVVILFDHHGVTLLPPGYANTSAPKGSWALIDSNGDVQTVPPIFTGQRCPYFVVVAAPLYSKRWWSLQRYRPRVKVWYMAPFTLEELIQASVSLLASFSTSVAHLRSTAVNLMKPDRARKTSRPFSGHMAHQPVNVLRGVPTSIATLQRSAKVSESYLWIR